jgi:hypothetical protein
MRRHAKTPVDLPEAPRAPERPRWSPSADLEPGAFESPARRLQLQVEAALAAPRADSWSARQTTAFLMLTNGLFWAGLVWGVRALF